MGPDGGCRLLARVAPQLYRSVLRTRDQLAKQPVGMNPGQTPATYFTRWNLLDMATTMLATRSAWPLLARVVTWVDEARGPGAPAEQARERLQGLLSEPNSNQGGGSSVVNCLDYPQRPTRRGELIRRVIAGVAAGTVRR